MPRAARLAPGGMIFHVLNRGNDRRDLLGDNEEFAVAARRDEHHDGLRYFEC